MPANRQPYSKDELDQMVDEKLRAPPPQVPLSPEAGRGTLLEKLKKAAKTPKV